MKSVLFSCFDCVRYNRDKNEDHEKCLRLIANASMDPLSECKRLRIISQIDRGINLDIFKMDDFSTSRGLGSGAFSEVCILIRKKDQRKFAGKFLKGEMLTKEFINEASIMKSCSTGCTGIVNVVGIITTPKCLVLDYYVNGSLDVAFLQDNASTERGNETEFPFLRRLGYILDMCHAVEVLHQKNICHRDIALRNLLLSNDKEHILLSDFSLSRTLNSAIERQSTLTAIVPAKSAPETFKNSTTSTPWIEKSERFYSLKTDIWSLGIVMFEIIDMELIHVDQSQPLPSGFPTKRLPSNKIFNRIEELWIQIISCWNENPERRPQSWEVHERIEMLSQNPLNIRTENEGYKTCYSDKPSPNIGYHYKDPNKKSCYLYLGAYTNLTPMSRVSVGEAEFSCSSMLESPSGSILAEPESPDGIDLLIAKDLIDKFSKEHKLTIQVNSDKSSSINHRRFKLNMSGDGNVSRNLIKRSSLNSSERKMCGQSIVNCQGTDGRRFINLGSLSTMGSCLSLYSPTLTSLEEASVISERLQYCSPLSASFRTSVTDIRYCGDRHFFQNVAHNFTLNGKAGNLVKSDSEVGEQSPSACQPSTVEGETPRYFVTVL